MIAIGFCAGNGTWVAQTDVARGGVVERSTLCNSGLLAGLSRGSQSAKTQIRFASIGFMGPSLIQPDLPLATPPAELRNVLLVPWGLNPPRGARRAAGLFDADGQYIMAGTCLRYGDDALTIEPEFDPPTEVETLTGRWLYGGLLYGHFGHFLCESTSRLWALDANFGEYDGVVWLPKVQLGHPAKMVRPYPPFFEALGFPGMPLRAPQKITKIETLVIPEQGFGIGLMASGRPQYRDFMRSHLGRDIAPAPIEKLYVSRSKLPSKRGSVLVEQQIEQEMAQAGYLIFHPEAHPIAEQIAYYKGADYIVGLDGSALHMAAMVAKPSAKVAILNRGPSQNIDDYARQFHHFCGIDVSKISAVSAYWYMAGSRVKKRETHAELDLEKIGNVLAELGFIGQKPWEPAVPADIASQIAEREANSGQALQRYEVAQADD